MTEIGLENRATTTFAIGPPAPSSSRPLIEAALFPFEFSPAEECSPSVVVVSLPVFPLAGVLLAGLPTGLPALPGLLSAGLLPAGLLPGRLLPAGRLSVTELPPWLFGTEPVSSGGV